MGTVYSTLCTVHSVQCTVYSTLYTVHCVQYTVYSALCTVYCIQYTVYSTLYTVHCVQYTVYSTLTHSVIPPLCDTTGMNTDLLTLLHCTYNLYTDILT